MTDVLVVGGGPAGLAAAIAAAEEGASVLLAERNEHLGGILNQCVHSGFGLQYFREELTGPEYAERLICKLRGTRVEVLTGAMVLHLSADKSARIMHPSGYRTVRSKAVVLAQGCRERAAGALAIPGTRPAGVMTAGTAQMMINMEGCMVGRRVVILGSGDIGLIMARRLTLTGAQVLCVCELMPWPGGLARNIAQCLEDFGIPLYLSTTVTEIRGDKRVSGALLSKVDAKHKPIPGTEKLVDCDTILLSVGLIPENELTSSAGAELCPMTGGPVVYENMETLLPGIFSCGNAAHVHDLADNASLEGERAGRAAALYARSEAPPKTRPFVRVLAGDRVSGIVPQRICEGAVVSFRPTKPFASCEITVTSAGRQLMTKKRSRMTPGEMEFLTLPERIVREAKGELVLGIEEA